jgi:hypothetical protein
VIGLRFNTGGDFGLGRAALEGLCALMRKKARPVHRFRSGPSDAAGDPRKNRTTFKRVQLRCAGASAIHNEAITLDFSKWSRRAHELSHRAT